MSSARPPWHAHRIGPSHLAIEAGYRRPPNETVFSYLQIYDPRERAMVGLADAGLSVLRAAARLTPGRRASTPPRRILLLRLERIGDLLMSAPAIQAVRAFAPDASIDLIVGSWNEPLARLIPGIDRVETLDAPWLARGAAGNGPRALLARAWEWRARQYDLAINFEGDIRSHALMALSGTPIRAGFDMAGGGPLLTIRLDHRPEEHTTANAWRLVEETFAALADASRRAGRRPAQATPHQPALSAEGEMGSPARGRPAVAGGAGQLRDPHVTNRGATAQERRAHASASERESESGSLRPAFRLDLPQDARARAAEMLRGRGRVIGMHASGGRAIKQWPARRFGEVAKRLLLEHEDATLLLTGTPGDRAMVDEALAVIREDPRLANSDARARIIDVTGEVELTMLAALLERCALYVTGDTGPMHLAAAVGAPIVCVFGPSAPARYAPISTEHRLVRIDLPCAPCNRIRLPPERCQGHTPDCLEGVTVDAVHRACIELLASRARAAGE